MSLPKHVIAQQHESFLSFLAHEGCTILTSQSSEGFIRWKDAFHEGVVRITAADQWQLLGDRLGNWDRCSNAAFEEDIDPKKPKTLTRALLNLVAKVGVKDDRKR